VILINDKDRVGIPKIIIDRANEEDLPLFIIPWDVKLIDIIQEIFFKIEQKREESKNAKHFLESLILSPNKQDEDIHTLAEFYNIKLRPFYYICIFKMEELLSTSNEIEDVSKYIIHSLEESLNRENYTLIPMNVLII